LALVKNGVPWHVAMSLSNEERVAFCIMFGELDGGVFDWGALSWRKPKG